MKKYDLSQITFVIPVYCDSYERMENLNCIKNWLNDNFETNIFISGQAGDNDVLRGIQNIQIDKATIKTFFLQTGIFKRTQAINNGIKQAKTPYVAIYDTDVIFDIESMLHAYEMLLSGYNMVYPYDGTFVEIDRSYIKDGIIIEQPSKVVGSKGGAVFVNKADYLAAGLENENIISWGPEDAERYHRMEKLGYKIYETDGKCYHITHERGVNSGTNNPHLQANMAEYEKIKTMSTADLKEYVKTWPWARN